MKKVLIVIGDIGSCHKTAAFALEEVFKEKYKNEITAKTADVFTFKPKKARKNINFLDKLFIKIFSHFASNEVYERMSKSRSRGKSAEFFFHLFNYFPLKHVFHWFLVRCKLYEFEQMVIENDPDIVVSIHPITTLYADKLKDRYGYKFKLVNVIVDLMTGQVAWYESHGDLYIPPSLEVSRELTNRRIPKKKISEVLFPLRPQFAKVKPREEVLKNLGLSPDVKTILLFGGGSGIYSSLSHLRKLSKKGEYQVIVVTGKAVKVKELLEKKYQDNSNIAILGFVDNAQDIINAADIVVTKPGTGTIIELEALNKKGLISHYIGGQELGNVWYLKQNPNFEYFGDRGFGFYDRLKLLESRKGLDNPRRSVNESYKIAELINNL